MYHGTTSGNHYVATSVVLGALSMLAKETGVTVFILNLAFDVYRCWPSIKKTMVDVKWNKKTTKFTARTIKVLVSLMVVIAARLALLQGALPTFSQQDNPTAFHPNFFVRLMTFCYLAAFNWWLLLCPWYLSHDWQMGSVPLVTSVGDPRNFVTCAAFGAVLFLSYRCLTDVETHRHVPLVLGLLLLVLPFMPATNLFVTVGFVIAERVLYIPSIGSVLITVYGAQLIWKSRLGGRTFVSIGLLVLVACGYARTIQRNRDWQSKEALLRTDLVTLPHNAKLHYNYANFLRDKERQDDAIQHYKEAIRLWPSYASAHNNLGTLIVTSGKAEYHFLQAIKYSQDHINAHYNLGKLYRKSNKYADALKMLERCIVLEPRFIQAYLELVLLKPGSERGGLLKKVINLEPNNWQHYISYGKWLSMQKLLTAALKIFMEALKTSQVISLKGTSHSRGDLIALRGASMTLRSLGQKSRILQLITRWHIFRKGSTNPATRNIYLREWHLKMELAGRAKIYAQVSHVPPNSKTCFDHSQLEITTESMQANRQPFAQSGANHYSDNDFSASVENSKYHNVKTNFRQTYIVVNENSSKSSITSGITECLQSCTDRHGTKQNNQKPSRTLSISTQYKLTHNRSESGHKRKECSSSQRAEHRKEHNKIRKCKVQNRVKGIEYAANDNIQPFLTEHLIQTF